MLPPLPWFGFRGNYIIYPFIFQLVIGKMGKKMEARKSGRADKAEEKRRRREEEKKKYPVICVNLCNLWTLFFSC
jgi:hypothetical protein